MLPVRRHVSGPDERARAPGCVRAAATAPDYPFGIPDHVHEAFLTEIARDWGGPVGLDVRAPSRLRDQQFRDSWARYLRSCASPGAAVALTRMNAEIDIRPILPAIRVPTLVVHRRGDRSISVEAGRYLAKHITGAKFVEAAGDDHLPWVGDADAVLGETEEFLTGARAVAHPDRVLATVLFTDIVDSTGARPSWATRHGRSSWRRTTRASASSSYAPAGGSQHRRRRVLRHVRRPGSCGPLCRGHP